MVLDYTFTKIMHQYYLEGSDEWEEDGDDYDWEYEIDEEDIANAFIGIFGKKKEKLEYNIKQVWNELLSDLDREKILKEMEETSFETLLLSAKKYLWTAIDHRTKKPKKVNAYTLLDYILGDISYYAEQEEEALKDWFYDKAEQDFYSNYDF